MNYLWDSNGVMCIVHNHSIESDKRITYPCSQTLYMRLIWLQLNVFDLCSFDSFCLLSGFLSTSYGVF